MGDSMLVQRTVQVVRSVASHSKGVGLSDLARATGIPKATCHRILTTLEHEGWVVSDTETHRFRLSLSLVFMTQDLANRGSASANTTSVLTELAQLVGETAGLDQLQGDSAMVISEVPGPHMISHANRPVPRLLPAWKTSTGKLLLAWGDPEVARNAFEIDRGEHPGQRHDSFDALLTELEEVRRRGYAVAQNDLEEGLAAVAAPVRIKGDVRYSIWVSGPSYRLTSERIPGIVDHVIAAGLSLGSILELQTPHDQTDALGALASQG